jgi:hypothetical protein
MENLKKFCSTDPTRPYIAEPFSFGEFTYATNGYVVVRVARVMDASEGREPMSAEVLSKALNPACAPSFVSLAGIVLPLDETPAADCINCEGEGDVECDECGHSHKCEACKGVGFTGSRRSISVGGVLFDAKYIEQINELPRVEIDAQPVDGAPMCFRFDGGIGALMPLTRDYERRLGDIRAYLTVSA